jgi:hypothetical protein
MDSYNTHRRKDSLSHRRTTSQRGLGNVQMPRLPPNPVLPTIAASPALPHQTFVQPDSPPLPPSPLPGVGLGLAADSHATPVPARPRTSTLRAIDNFVWPKKAARAAASVSLPSPRRTRNALVLVVVLLLSAGFFFRAPAAASIASAAIPLRDALTPGKAIPKWRPGAHSTLASTHWRRPAAKGPGLALSPAEELGAVTSFLAALPENQLPGGADPAAPVDPELVLDFDTRAPGARDELADVVRDVWARNPVVIFGKVRARVAPCWRAG